MSARERGYNPDDFDPRWDDYKIGYSPENTPDDPHAADEVHVQDIQVGKVENDADELFPTPYFAVQFKSFDMETDEVDVELFVSTVGLNVTGRKAFMATLKYLVEKFTESQ